MSTLMKMLGAATTRRTDKAIKRAMRAMLHKQYLIKQAELDSLELTDSVTGAIKQVRAVLGVSLSVARTIAAK